jgi:hypothetical protein
MLTFESSPRSRIVSKTRTYSSSSASASSGVEISSPRTSIVAIRPRSFSSSTTRHASSSVSPAM